MKNELTSQHKTVFETIKEVDANGNEFWGARKLSKVLEYSEFRHFLPVIERAKEACANSGQQIQDHFEDYLEEIVHGKSTELAANLFRATQTEGKLRRDKIKGKQKANQTHFEIGKKVRKTIEEIGGTMPENLPVADSIKKLEKAKEPKLLKTHKKKKS